MRITRRELRNIIREEFANGIPEFALQEVAIDTAKKARALILKYVQERAESEQHAREILQSAEETIHLVESDVHEVLAKRLSSFVRYV